MAHRDSKSLNEGAVHSIHAQAHEFDSHIGAQKVEVAQKVYGKYSRRLLFLGLIQVPSDTL